MYISAGKALWKQTANQDNIASMRCYFIRDGHIVAVELIPKRTDEESISDARKMFDLKGQSHEAQGFEVWDQGRFIYRYPECPERA